MRFSKPLLTAGLVLPCPTLLAHAGHHHGGLLAELRHTLSAPDHAVPLLMGIAAIVLVIRHLTSKPSSRRKAHRAAVKPR